MREGGQNGHFLLYNLHKIMRITLIVQCDVWTQNQKLNKTLENILEKYICSYLKDTPNIIKWLRICINKNVHY